ncbi:MbtH family protein [Cupriavidus sp. AU9028]|uniref:MbtH family protein n=1 Tax=Cupriavidus sp. AU9028 TaxID=2871157 RepID=UPI001C981436|nr:MbtH family protein [Cupriavidus sp. AU9028]MBY4899104.1 MbtH family protein [Cupriavidus sp. AU9028]
MSFDRDDATFLVLVNHEEQYSIWPEWKPVPGGWRPAGFSGERQACLDHIERIWTDMRPLSLRRFMEEQTRADA